MSFYQELVTTTERILVQRGINPERVSEIARAVVDGIREDFGGLMIYAPKVDKNKVRQRDEVIRKMFNDGSDLEFLARQFNITVRQVYRIINL